MPEKEKKAKKEPPRPAPRGADGGPAPPVAPTGPPPVAPRTASGPEGSKQIPRATKTLEGTARREQLRQSLEQRVRRPDVVRTPDFATSGPAAVTVPRPAPTTPVPAAAARPAAPASAGPTPVALPDWFRPDPEGPFPQTSDDVPIDFYPILEPYAYVLVTYNNRERETIYRVVEPRLTDDEKKILKFVENTMVDVLDIDPSELDKKGQAEFLAGKMDEILYDYSIVLGETEGAGKAVRGKLLYYLHRDFIGEGRIDVMVRDELIEDISCDGPHQPIFLYHRRHESIKSNVKFPTEPELDSFVIRMAQRAGRHISIADPILDATMRDGSRLQATLSHEVSSHGSTFTIRKFRSEPFTPPDLVRFGTMSPEILAYLWLAIQYASSAIYAGGTASGKTTSLNAILLFIPPQMKIVSIEDTRELALPHPNWIAGITRPGFGARDALGHQVGEIDMFQLLKNALRQRPEYIIVGEVRGKEAYNLFQAMATGHAAYGTMHADSVDAVIHRLESDPINIPRSLLEALDIVSVQIQTRVGGKRVRRTKQIAEIVGIDPHTREILTNEVFRWQPKDDSFQFSGVSYVLERIQVEKGMTPVQMRQELESRAEIMRYMARHAVRHYRDVWGIVTSYYKDPAATMERVRKDEPWT